MTQATAVYLPVFYINNNNIRYYDASGKLQYGYKP